MKESDPASKPGRVVTGLCPVQGGSKTRHHTIIGLRAHRIESLVHY
jgi:hypothetical protein